MYTINKSVIRIGDITKFDDAEIIDVEQDDSAENDMENFDYRIINEKHATICTILNKECLESMCKCEHCDICKAYRKGLTFSDSTKNETKE